MKLVQSFVIAMSMYSKLPMPRIEWKEENMKYAMCFFPMVGVVTGLLEYLAGRVLLEISCGKLFFAAVMTLIPVCISGGIHLDGFMDTMDALASYGDREKKLAILKDSHSGAFAILGLGCYFVWSLGVWSEVTQEMLGVIGCVFVVSRALSGFSVVSFQAAKNSGLLRTFRDGAQKRAVRITMAAYLIVVATVMIWQSPVMAAGAVTGAAVTFGYYRYVSYKQFGGVTGDLAGYFLQICELVMLTGVMICGRVG